MRACLVNPLQTPDMEEILEHEKQDKNSWTGNYDWEQLITWIKAPSQAASILWDVENNENTIANFYLSSTTLTSQLKILTFWGKVTSGGVKFDGFTVAT